jgi:SARP family transcriptional regulator, regulator of embCAB operon
VQHATSSSRVQLCGSFVVELCGRRVDTSLPGRQGRLLFAYLVLSRPHPISRDVLIDALWPDAPPAGAAAALSVVISKTRAVIGADVLRGRTELSLALPEPAQIDVEKALAAVHVAESASARRDWKRAWPAALQARFIARRRFLPEAETPWAESWRRRLFDIHVRALECYGTACLELANAELPAGERAARELVEIAPLNETGHLLLIRALAARGNVAEALTAYERLRVLLREELGVNPGPAVQRLYSELLR